MKAPLLITLAAFAAVGIIVATRFTGNAPTQMPGSSVVTAPRIAAILNAGLAELDAVDPSPIPAFSKEEVRTHNQESDCWLIIHGKIYDVTRWIPDHPGGKEVLAAQCGKDATAGFELRPAGAGPHSQDARNELPRFFIGDLASS